MEPNQTNTSPEIAGIPEGIPTGVFVPNNQVPVTTDIPVQNVVPTVPVQAPVVTPTVAQPVAVESTPVVSPVVEQSTVAQLPVGQPVEWPLDKIFKWLARFFAKVMGQPDPITWAVNPASKALQQSENIVGKVWGAANQAVTKATDVAAKAADTVNQATQSVQQLIPPPTIQPVSTPEVQPSVVASTPVVSPVVEQPSVPQTPVA